jgi:hypothetical protein
MEPDALRLRLLDFFAVDNRRQWLFIALTDTELRAFETGEQTSFAPFKNRIISGYADEEPTEDQRRTALRAFGLRFGRVV